MTVNERFIKQIQSVMTLEQARELCFPDINLYRKKGSAISGYFNTRVNVNSIVQFGVLKIEDKKVLTEELNGYETSICKTFNISAEKIEEIKAGWRSSFKQ